MRFDGNRRIRVHRFQFHQVHILNNLYYVYITNVDSLKYGSNLKNLKDLEIDSRYSFVQGDIADYALTSKIIADADTIINFAAEMHVDRSIQIRL